jgi:hypothetical protein
MPTSWLYYITMTKQDQYYTMWARYRVGQISEKEWKTFCTEILNEILQEQEVQDVMKRLKHR